MSKRAFWNVVLDRYRAFLPAMVAAFGMLDVGLLYLNRPALWSDELATDGAVRLSLVNLFKLVCNFDQVIAPYYFLMHLWTQVFGFSEFSERFPSVVAMSLAAGLCCDIARRLWGQRTAYFAAVLFMVVPMVTRFAQEARPYALSVAAMTWAMWFVLARENFSIRSDIRLAAVVCFGGLMQPVSLLGVPALLYVAMTRERRRVEQRRRIFVLLGLAGVPAAVLFLWGFLVQSQVWNWIVPQPWTNGPMRASSVYGSGEVGGAMLVLAAVSLRRKGPEMVLFLWGIAPLVVLFLIGMKLPIFTGRLLEFTIPATVLLAARTATSLTRAGAVAVCCGVILLSLPDQVAMRGPGGHSQDNRMVGSIIGQQEKPGDTIVYGDMPQSIPWTPRDAVRYYVPKERTPKDVLARTPQRYEGHFLAQLCDSAAKCLGSPHRIWVVRNDQVSDPRDSLPGGVSPLLQEHYRVVSVWHGKQLTVGLLERASR